jgi:V/A-type H+-transporting ATPase subunit I
MPWPEQFVTVPMTRVGVVASMSRLRRVLVETADAGVFEPDAHESDTPLVTPSAGAETAAIEPRLREEQMTEADPTARARPDLLLGEAEVQRIAARAQLTERCAVLTGWLPRRDVDSLRKRLAPHGGAVAELRPRRGVTPPTAYGHRPSTAALRPLVSTYATIPYRDIDPVWFAGIAYMLMFGMMFGDVAHGLAVVALGTAALGLSGARIGRLRPAAPFLIGAGAAAVLFGLLYGEAFGPTGLVPTLWIEPLEEPEVLLLAGLVGGSGLLAFTFVLAAINRWREGGPALALYAASGIAGSLLFAGAAALIGGLVGSIDWLWQLGLVVAGAGAVLTFIGLLVQAGGGAAAIAQALVEMFDTVLRLGSNVVSFTRLAAFGLTHAVMTGVVWDGTVDLWERSTLFAFVAAIALFAVGNVAAFALGALVGAIQALRLEYYELFSRLFATEGRPFEPWHIPVERTEPT